MSTFKLAGASAEFNARADSLVKAIEKYKHNDVEEESDEENILDSIHTDTFQKGRQNSSTWTHYSLKDVPDMSDGDNQLAAHVTIETQTENNLSKKITNISLSDVQLPQKGNTSDIELLRKRTKKNLILLDEDEE